MPGKVFCYVKVFCVTFFFFLVSMDYTSLNKVVNSDFMSWDAELQPFNKNRQHVYWNVESF